MKKNRILFTTVLSSLLLLNTSAYAAGGYRVAAQATPDNGVAFAGEAVVARDAATAIKNPAGMPLLDSSQFLIGMQPAAYWAFWDFDKKTTFNGNKGGNGGACFFGSGLSIVYKFTDKFCGGFGIFTPGAVGGNFGRDWKGRFFIQRQLGPTIAGNWSLAYQVTSKLSLGSGLSIGYGYLNSATALPDENLFSTLPNRDRMKLNFDNWKRVDLGKLAYGFNVGAIYQFTSCTRIGIYYHSQMNYRLHGTIETITAAAGATYSSGSTVFKIPQIVIISFYHKITPCLTLLANFEWDNNSIVDKSTLKLKDGTVYTQKINWHDTVGFAFGAEYQKSERLTLQGGISWDSSPVTTKDRIVSLGYSNALFLGTGALYKINCNETLGFSALYNCAIPRARGIDNELFGYRFKAKSIQDSVILAFNWNRKFG